MFQTSFVFDGTYSDYSGEKLDQSKIAYNHTSVMNHTKLSNEATVL